jgi:archaellum biogenesis ATPase FlaH
LIEQFIQKYNNIPSKESLFIDLSNYDKIDDKQFDKCKEIVNELSINQETSVDWLIDESEKFCQTKAIYLALNKSLEIYNDKDDKLAITGIPDILSDAISISFDSRIGHDYFDDSGKRYDFYHEVTHKIPFHIDYLNRITKGGISKKSITILMAGPGVGKSTVMCDFAAHNLTEGKNVLYITLEMSEEMIAQRIDENLMDLNVDELLTLPKSTFINKIESLKNKTVGKLIIHEYPTGQAGSANFRALLRDLKIKRNFIPDIIYVDYLNICASSRIKRGGATLYEYMKAVGEELRGLAVEFEIPVVTATQFNRTGSKNSDPGMDDVAESFGTAFTADLFIALVSNEELEKINQIMFVQIKNRYNDVNFFKRFIVGIDRSKMKLYDVDESEQNLSATKISEKNDMFITPDLERKLPKRSFEDFT